MKTSKFFFGAMLAVACTAALVGCKKDEGTSSDPFDNNDKDGGDEIVTPTPGDRDGSEANPYNVQDLLDMKTNSTLPDKDDGKVKSWVSGYIVGSYNFKNDPKWIIGTDNAVTTNVLIADAADCTDTYAVATVKLGDFASVLNLSANPGNLGKKLTLYGIVEKYCGVAGVVKLEKALLDGAAVELPDEDDATVTDNMTVAEALAAASSLKSGATTSGTATVIGYVTEIKTAYDATYGNVSFYMSDDKNATAAQGDFLAFRVKGDAAETVAKGNKVKVTAQLTNYKGNTPETVAGGTFEIIAE